MGYRWRKFGSVFACIKISAWHRRKNMRIVKVIKTVAVGTMLAISGFSVAGEMSEPWEFNTKYIQKSSQWEIGYFQSDDDYRRKKDEPRIWMRKLGKDGLKKRIEEDNYQVQSDDEAITKELISLINKFNKLDASKALTKVEVESKHAFSIGTVVDHTTEESEKLKFYEFIKLKHDPITLDNVGRNEKDSKTRNRCTMLVTYELVDEAKGEDKKEDEQKTEGEEKPTKKHLKTNYYYLDESQGNESEFHLFKPDGNWDRMEQR